MSHETHNCGNHLIKPILSRPFRVFNYGILCLSMAAANDWTGLDYHPTDKVIAEDVAKLAGRCRCWDTVMLRRNLRSTH